jgi:hypothetical protein
VRQNGGRGGAIAGDVIGFSSSFFKQLSTHVFEWVF